MKRSTVIFDQPPWWQRPGWQIAAAAALALAALPIWWSALAPVDHEPVALHTPAPPPVVARSAPRADTTAPAEPSVPAAPSPEVSSPASTPPLSTMVAPGMHITPLGVPPGTTPNPAGPGANDTEPEN